MSQVSFLNKTITASNDAKEMIKFIIGDNESAEFRVEVMAGKTFIKSKDALVELAGASQYKTGDVFNIDKELKIISETLVERKNNGATIVGSAPSMGSRFSF